MTINAEVQKLETDNVVTLFRLDTSPIGGTTVFNFTKKMRDGASISFGGVPYYGIDVDASGFLWDGRGNFPTPKLQVSNVANLLTAAIADRGDLVGATLTRIRTFEQFLDDGATPDSAAIFPLDIYTVQQKTKHNKVFIEWSLSSILDQTGRQIPARTMLRDVCSFSYRLYNPATGTFDTSTACLLYTSDAADE